MAVCISPSDFHDWVQGTRVSVDLGTGITPLESCWNVAQHPAANLSHGGNGQPRECCIACAIHHRKSPWAAC